MIGFSSFLKLNNMSHFVYPFIHRWTLGLLLIFGSCSCYELEYTHISEILLLILLSIYPDEASEIFLLFVCIA